MNRNKRNGLLTLAGVALALSGVALGLCWTAMKSQTRISDSYEQRHRAHQLASELHRSSNDLTRMARLYSVTGDARYTEYFQRILAIRHGDAPRPSRYSGAYWDLVADAGQYPQEDGGEAEPVALRDLMAEAGFSEDEFAKLQLAESRSDELAAIEEAAMQATPEELQAAAELHPDAVKELHGAEYLRAKAQIMQPIEEMQESLDQRTNAEIEEAAADQNVMFTVLLTALGVTVLASAGSFVWIAATARAET